MASILIKNGLALMAMLVLASTTPFHRLLSAMRRLGVPAVLVATLQFMDRYRHVLVDELDRMVDRAPGAHLPRRGLLSWGTPGRADRDAVPPLVRTRRAGPRRHDRPGMGRDDPEPGGSGPTMTADASDGLPTPMPGGSLRDRGPGLGIVLPISRRPGGAAGGRPDDPVGRVGRPGRPERRGEEHASAPSQWAVAREGAWGDRTCACVRRRARR